MGSAAAARSPPYHTGGIGAGGDRAAPWSRLLERDRVHRLRDLVDDQVGELRPLSAVEPLHRGDHPHHQQRDEQDQADVFDRPLPALALERGDYPAGTEQELRLDVCGEPCEHGCLPGRFADRPGHGHTAPDADVSPYRRFGGERRVTLGEAAAGAAGDRPHVTTTNTQPYGRAARIVVVATALVVALAALAGTAQARGGGSFIGVVDPFPTRCGADQKHGDCLSFRDLRRMRRAHLKIVRWGFRWDDVEGTKGLYRWGVTDDDTVGALATRGIRVLPVMTGSPTWAAPTFGTAPVNTREARKGWQRFLKAAVKRDGPKGEYWTNPGLYRTEFPGGPIRPIKTWQIWNEQNIQGGRQRVLPRKYARLVRLSHNAIDAANPRAKILLGGMPGYIRSRAWVYLNKLYERHGLKRKFDAVALHPYSPDVGHVLVQIKQMRRVMRKHHDAGAGLWITELGWGSKRPSEGQPINKGLKGQKRLLKATFPILKRYHRRWNLRHAFWFRWRDPPHGTGGCTFCSSSGLLHHDQKPKPAWRAFKHITKPR